MTTKDITVLLLVVMAATVAVARARRTAAGEPATTTYQVVGVVTASPADGRVMVSHQDIPGYMPAMTMPFAVAPGTPASLSPGDRVRFTLRVGADWSRAEDFVKLGRDEAVAAALRDAPARARTRLKKGDALPAFTLKTHEGTPFTEADARGRLTVLTFIFTRCPVPEYCPLMSRRFQQLQRQLESEPALRDVRLVSVSLDPQFDTPAVLAAYAASLGARSERWQLLTGDPAEVARLTEAFSVHTERNGVLLEHTLATAVLDGDGRIAEIWRGNGWTSGDVLTILRRAVAHPAAEREGR